MNLNDYKEKYDKLQLKRNLSGDEALAAVKVNGYALQYVKDQTNEICLAAVKVNGNALQYVADQTNEICLAAIKEDGYALRYVEENMFTDEKIINVNGKQVSMSTIEIALKQYFE